MYSCNSTAQKDRATRENGPVTELELRSYSPSRSCCYASHQSRSRSSIPNRPLVPVTGVPLSSSHLRPTPRGWYCVWCGGCCVVAGTDLLHEQVCTSSRTLRDTHRDRGSYIHLRLVDFMQHASRHWACYHHTAHSTSLEARVSSDSGTPVTGTKGRLGKEDLNRDWWLA